MTNECFFFENRALFQIMWKNVVQTDGQMDSIIRRMHTAYWITEATDTHSEFVMLTVNRWQQWLRERASVLSSMYISDLL